MINLYAIPPLICGLLVFFMGLIVLIKNPRSATHIKFSLTCLAITLWFIIYAINYLLSFHVEDKSLIINIFKLGNLCTSLIPILLFDFVTTFLNLDWTKWWRNLNYVIWAIFYSLILTTNLIDNGAQLFHWGYYPVAGKFHPIFLSFFVFTTVSALALLIQAVKTESNLHRKLQCKYLLLAFTVLSIGILDYMQNYGMAIYPFGFISTTIFVCIVLYAMVRHQLLDINVFIKKSILYSLLITIITFVYSLSIILLENLSRSIFGYQSIWATLIASGIIALTFIPLHNLLQRWVDQIFLKNHPVELAEENELLRLEAMQKERFRVAAILASSLAHEIKNPLTALKTFSSYVPIKKDDPEFIEKFNSITQVEFERIEQLVKNLLNFAKPSEPHWQSVDIHELIQKILLLLSNEAQKKSIQITTLFMSSAPRLNLDPSLMQQALINILINSIEAMEYGEITVKTEFVKNDFLITISDSGCGIDLKDLPYIFEPFYTKKMSGTGLGLAITKGIIEEHKGRILVESQLGKGTTFRIQLPI